VKATATFFEARWLPATISGVLILLGVVVLFSASTTATRIVGTCAFLASIWPLFRCLNPRWVVKIEPGKVLLHDLTLRKVTEVDLSKVQSVRIDEITVPNSGADGGIGFQKQIVFQGREHSWTLPLPLLQARVQDVAEAIRSHLANPSESGQPNASNARPAPPK
jgi:hypothetical protein